MANRVLLEREIKEYCKINNINDVAGFITQCMFRGFNIFKYGMSPGDNIKKQTGEIVDRTKNRGRKPKNELISQEQKKEEKQPDIIQETKVDTKERTTETETNSIKEEIIPTIVKKKRKIIVTKID